MRILLTSTSFWPHVGGVEVLGANFVGGLRRRGHEVLVVTDYDDADAAARDEVDGVPVVRIKMRRAIAARDLAAIVASRRQFAAEREAFAPDLEHIYHPGSELALGATARARMPLPTVFTLHLTPPLELLSATSSYGRVLREADWITACSESTLADVVGVVPELRTRSSVVINALPPPREARAAIVPPPDQPTILFLGRLDPQKGFDLGLEAIARLRADGFSDLRAIVAGDGFDRQLLESLVVRLGIGDAVEFRGWVEPADVGGLISRSSILAMPSRYEPFGLVALQAAQYGRPLVGSAVDGLVEAVADGVTGILTPTEDVGALTAALAALLRDPARAQALGAEGRRRALDGDAWQRHLLANEEVYERVVA